MFTCLAINWIFRSPVNLREYIGQTIKGATESLGIQGDKQESVEATEEKQPDAASESMETAEGISAAQASEGLKEALTVGVQKAVKLAGIEDGFYKNSAIIILLPEKHTTLPMKTCRQS